MPYTAEGYRARALRNAMTKPEVIPWSRLKRLRAEGFHVRRQAPFRGYYLDFVCFARRVVIEVDGSSHDEPEQTAHDTVRDAVLRREGFRVLRFGNDEVRENLAGVMARGSARRWRKPQSPHPARARGASHPPHKGEGLHLNSCLT